MKVVAGMREIDIEFYCTVRILLKFVAQNYHKCRKTVRMWGNIEF